MLIRKLVKIQHDLLQMNEDSKMDSISSCKDAPEATDNMCIPSIVSSYFKVLGSKLHKKFLQSRRNIHHSRDGTIL
jgi:formyltetrahydrofolate hydrolase